LETFDYDTRNDYNQDFSISMPRTDEEKARIEKGETIPLLFVGNGIIWPDATRALTQEEIDDLPY